MLRIIHCFPRFRRFGGAQKVIMTIFSFFRNEYPSFVSSFQKYDDIIGILKKTLSKKEYIVLSLNNFSKLKDSVVFSHDRKVTLLLVIVSKFISIKVVHVAHNVFTDKKIFTLLPKRIVAVSIAVKNNLIDYFGVSKDQIDVIYNGIEDSEEDAKTIDYVERGEVKILFLAQIEPVKQQLDTIEFLKDKLNKNICIDFAGDGKDSVKLQEFIYDNNLHGQFRYLGFVNNVNELIKQYHYVMLFSKKEGLGLSLIEACMLSRPVITRGIDGCEACAEICIDKHNGFVANNFKELESVLNSINLISVDVYQGMCKNARKTYEEKFSLRIMKENYRNYLSHI